jgi:hypothetical protein
MAKIVCTQTTTDKSTAGDVISIHEDDVELTGPGYEYADIIHVEGKKRNEVRAIFNAKVPEQKTAHKLPVAGKWQFMEEKPVWKHSDGKWYDLVERPKYQITVKDITESDKTNLDSKLVNLSTKESILDKACDNISLNAKNLIEVKDLNV